MSQRYQLLCSNNNVCVYHYRFRSVLGSYSRNTVHVASVLLLVAVVGVISLLVHILLLTEQITKVDCIR